MLEPTNCSQIDLIFPHFACFIFALHFIRLYLSIAYVPPSSSLVSVGAYLSCFFWFHSVKDITMTTSILSIFSKTVSRLRKQPILLHVLGSMEAILMFHVSKYCICVFFGSIFVKHIPIPITSDNSLLFFIISFAGVAISDTPARSGIIAA
jgi:hypothetical protein